MMKSRIICILLLLVGVSGIYAQSLTVTGKVVDNEGLEVIGGNVTVKGKQNTGTITDINGRYTITVSDPQKDVWFSLLSDWKYGSSCERKETD